MEEQTVDNPQSVPEESAQTTVEPQAVEAQQVDWKASLDEALRNEPCMKNVPDVQTLVKNYINAQKAIGKKGVILPSEKDGDDAWDKVYEQLGRPEAPDKYTAPQLEVDPELEQFVSQDKIKKFADIAHKAGLTDKQFQKIAGEYTKFQLEEVKGVIDAEKSTRTEAEKELKKQWGLDYEVNSKQAEKVLEKIGKDIPAERIEQYKSDPFIKRLMGNVAKIVSEDKFVDSSAYGAMKPSEMKSEISRLMGDKSSSYWNPMAPDHVETKEKVRSYYEALARVEDGK